MVELFKKDLIEEKRRSSNGNQLKWENGGIWYKADNLGYEGLSEYIVSNLLKLSSLSSNEFVVYGTEEIRYNKVILSGCRSNDFSGGWQIITLERLFSNIYGTGLYKGIFSINDHEERLKYLVKQAERVTGITGFGIYMCKLLTLDAIFLNEDRHTHNISVLTDGNNNFRLCPIYDNGAALLSDTAMDYPITENIYELIYRVRAKTICDSFDEQLEIAEKLYGITLTFSFTKKDVKKLLDSATIYDKRVRNRVYDVLLEQMRKYSAYFE